MKILGFLGLLTFLAPAALAAGPESVQRQQAEPEAGGSAPATDASAPLVGPPAAKKAPATGTEDEAATGTEAEAATGTEAAPGTGTEAAPAPDDVAEPPEVEADLYAPVAGPVPWEDPDRKIAATARGAIDACETVAFPLTLIPGIGSIAGSVIEWACLVPAALAIDYVGVNHTGQESFLWQPLLALLAAKLYRAVVLTVGITAIALSAALYVTVVSAALVVANASYYIPIGLTGVITVIGAMILGMNVIEKVGSDLIFLGTYKTLANTLTTPAEAAAAQERAWVKPPPGPFGRSLALLSAAAGAEPRGEWTHAIPVAGPLFRANAKADAVEQATLQVGRDVLGERPQYPEELHMTAELTTWTEAIFGAVGQALLGVGATIFVAGTILSAVSYEQNADVVEFALVAGGIGSAGVFVAGGGVVFILLRQVPRIVRGLFVPAAFGLWPPPEEEEAE